jgi:hypothetical protein
LNALLDAEADRLCNAQRYERSAARRDTRAGHYERNLQTKAGEGAAEGAEASPADVRNLLSVLPESGLFYLLELQDSISARNLCAFCVDVWCTTAH